MMDYKSKLSLDAQEHNKEIQKAANEVKEYDKTIRQTAKQTREAIKSQRAMAAQVKYLGKEADNAKASIGNMYGALRSGNFQHIGTEIKSLTGNIKALGTVSGKFSIGNLVGNLGKIPGLAATAATAIAGLTVAMGVNAAKKANELNEALADLSKLTGAKGDELKGYGKAAQEMSSRTGFAAKDIVKSMGLIGSQAPELLKDAAALQAVTDAANTFSLASGMEVVDSAKAITTVMNQMGAASTEAKDIINTLAAAEQAGSKSASEVATAIEKSGTAAKNAGLNYRQLVAVIETIGPKFSSADVEGTALTAVFTRLETQADKNLKPSIVGLSKALDNLAAKKMSVAELNKLFGETGMVAGQALIEMRGDLAEMEQAITGTNTAYEQAAIETEKLSTKTNILKESWNNLLITIGNSELISAAVGLIGEAVDSLNGFINKLNSLNEPIAQIEGTIKRLNDVVKIFSKGRDEDESWTNWCKRMEVSTVQFAISVAKWGNTIYYKIKDNEDEARRLNDELDKLSRDIDINVHLKTDYSSAASAIASAVGSVVGQITGTNTPKPTPTVTTPTVTTPTVTTPKKTTSSHSTKTVDPITKAEQDYIKTINNLTFRLKAGYMTQKEYDQALENAQKSLLNTYYTNVDLNKAGKKTLERVQELNKALKKTTEALTEDEKKLKIETGTNDYNKALKLLSDKFNGGYITEEEYYEALAQAQKTFFELLTNNLDLSNMTEKETKTLNDLMKQQRSTQKTLAKLKDKDFTAANEAVKKLGKLKLDSVDGIDVLKENRPAIANGQYRGHYVKTEGVSGVQAQGFYGVTNEGATTQIYPTFDNPKGNPIHKGNRGKVKADSFENIIDVYEQLEEIYKADDEARRVLLSGILQKNGYSKTLADGIVEYLDIVNALNESNSYIFSLEDMSKENIIENLNKRGIKFDDKLYDEIKDSYLYIGLLFSDLFNFDDLGEIRTLSKDELKKRFPSKNDEELDELNTYLESFIEYNRMANNVGNVIGEKGKIARHNLFSKDMMEDIFQGYFNEIDREIYDTLPQEAKRVYDELLDAMFKMQEDIYTPYEFWLVFLDKAKQLPQILNKYSSDLAIGVNELGKIDIEKTYNIDSAISQVDKLKTIIDPLIEKLPEETRTAIQSAIERAEQEVEDLTKGKNSLDIDINNFKLPMFEELITTLKAYGVHYMTQEGVKMSKVIDDINKAYIEAIKPESITTMSGYVGSIIGKKGSDDVRNLDYNEMYDTLKQELENPNISAVLTDAVKSKFNILSDIVSKINTANEEDRIKLIPDYITAYNDVIQQMKDDGVDIESQIGTSVRNLNRLGELNQYATSAVDAEVAKNEAAASSNIAELQRLYQEAKKTQLQGQRYEFIKDYVGGIESATNATTGLISTFKQLGESWEDMDGWERFTSITSSIFDTINAVFTFIDALNQIGTAVQGIKEIGAAIKNIGTVSKAVNAGADAGEIAITGVKAAANMKLAASEVIAKYAAIPYVGAELAAAEIAELEALMLTLPTFSQGGVIGGNKRFGDFNLARVNSGEAVFTTKQQDRLFDILDGNASVGGGMSGDVRFIIHGDTLEGVLENRRKKKHKLM